MQALHALALKPIAETLGDRKSYGFREGRSCADAIGQCFCALAKSYALVWVLEGEIKGHLDPYSYYTLAAAGWSKSCGWLFENSIVPDQSSRIIPASTSLTSPPK
jgi:retron-type reverse transcriptase